MSFDDDFIWWCPYKLKEVNNSENKLLDNEIKKDLINEFGDLNLDDFDWDDLSLNQNLSEYFIIKYCKKLYPMNILKNRKIIFSKDFLIRYLLYYKKWYKLNFNYDNDSLKYLPIKRYLIFKLPNLPMDVCKIINLYYK